jgi:predicted porin
MKKSLLALAVLTAVTGAASAQSSVTLYGKVDVGLVLDSGAGYVTGSPAQGKSIRISSGVTGGSRLGFKGVEDLGGGMKAAFQLETGFCADSASQTATGSAGSTPAPFCTGGNNFMGRQAYGALSGGFGSLSAGRQYSLGFNNLSTIDPFGTGYAGQVNNLVANQGLRLNNSATYNTPTMGGVTASIEVALGEQTGNFAGGRETGAGVTYASGPAYLGATYHGVENAAGTSTAQKDYLLGGTYDFGVVKLHALVAKTTGIGLNSNNSMSIMGGATVPLGGGNLMASYVHFNDRTAADKDATQFGIGYNYPLSKRTAIYTAFARIKDSNGAQFTVGNATEVGSGNKAFNLGVVHNF